jgi:hypothetical protein
MRRLATTAVVLGLVLAGCGVLDEDCPGMPSGATCCDGVHYCDAGKTCNNSNGTCVSGAASGTCSQAGAVEYFTQNCHRVNGGIEFVGAPWPKSCGTCPAGVTTTSGSDTVTAGGPYWLCTCN